jgi:hypothetical protein
MIEKARERSLENTRGQKSSVAFGWAGRMAAAGLMALVLSIAVFRGTPDIGRKILAFTDFLVLEPAITTAYLFGGEETLAKIGVDELPEQYRPAPVNFPVNRNVLGSYIVNNRGRLPAGTGEFVRIVPKEALDGRVAGASADNTTVDKPSRKLLKISQKPKPPLTAKEFFKVWGNIFVDAQKKLADRAERKAGQFIK